jgi:hypothetical protein
MIEGIEGRGRLLRDGQTLCHVRYELQLQDAGDASRFTLTDGLIEIEEEPASGAAIEIEPGRELTLALDHPLADGRETLTLIVEPYAGHRPDERYQVSVKENEA